MWSGTARHGGLELATRHRPTRSRRLGQLALLVGISGLVVAVALWPRESAAAASQTWPPFALVVGLLLIGVVANGDGVFAAAGTALARLRVHQAGMLVTLLGLVAVVTAVLNLDTSVAFLTPVLVLAARRRGLDEEPFLYGTLLMSNAASLLLPGSNLTNLLVVGERPPSCSSCLHPQRRCFWSGSPSPSWPAFAVASPVLTSGRAST